MTDEKIEVLVRAIIYAINLVTNVRTNPEDILSALSKVRRHYISQKIADNGITVTK